MPTAIHQGAERTGVDSGILKKMLPLLASVAMGALAKNGFSGGTGAPDQLAAGADRPSPEPPVARHRQISA